MFPSSRSCLIPRDRPTLSSLTGNGDSPKVAAKSPHRGWVPAEGHISKYSRPEVCSGHCGYPHQPPLPEASHPPVPTPKCPSAGSKIGPATEVMLAELPPGGKAAAVSALSRASSCRQTQAGWNRAGQAALKGSLSPSGQPNSQQQRGSPLVCSHCLGPLGHCAQGVARVSLSHNTTPGARPELCWKGGTQAEMSSPILPFPVLHQGWACSTAVCLGEECTKPTMISSPCLQSFLGQAAKAGNTHRGTLGQVCHSMNPKKCPAAGELWQGPPECMQLGPEGAGSRPRPSGPTHQQLPAPSGRASRATASTEPVVMVTRSGSARGKPRCEAGAPA